MPRLLLTSNLMTAAASVSCMRRVCVSVMFHARPYRLSCESAVLTLLSLFVLR
jgi:hypothetical protein